MQTKQRIQALLAQAGTHPLRHLGQNFLIDLNLMRLLVDSAQITDRDVVLEVGGGTGSLTAALAERAGYVVMVEYDIRLASIARAQLADHTNVEVLNLDILAGKHAFSPGVLTALTAAQSRCNGRLLLVANLPYQVACPVIMNLILQSPVASTMVVTVQKEVAERLTAGPGTPHYGLLSVLLAITGQTRTIRHLKPSVFWPPPRVESAMIRFDRLSNRVAKIVNLDVLIACLDLFMQHRRKMLRGSLKLAGGRLASCDWGRAFAVAGVSSTMRPEHVTPDEFVRLANAVCAQATT